MMANLFPAPEKALNLSAELPRQGWQGDKKTGEEIYEVSATREEEEVM